LRRLLPRAGPHQVVPLRDPVAQRAAGGVAGAERDAAVHAAGGLRAHQRPVRGRVHLPPVGQPDRYRPARLQPPRVAQETAWVSHGPPPPPAPTSRPSPRRPRPPPAPGRPASPPGPAATRAGPAR